jgi:hypothetical protein
MRFLSRLLLAWTIVYLGAFILGAGFALRDVYFSYYTMFF